MAAITTSRALQREGRPATEEEQRILARWSSWGALAQVFDETKTDWEARREQLKQLLSPEEYAAARLTTINAHYTDPAYAREIWKAIERLGFDGGEVLEPGSGAGVFIGLAPDDAHMVGVELDTTTAAIAAGLYPNATVRQESFADSRFEPGSFDAVVGNVPFSDVALHDPVHNRGNHSMHDHFIVKSLALTRPGGVVGVLTSRYTLDKQSDKARREMSEYADLLGAVRLPTGAHRRAAGTEVVTDLLVFRRREQGSAPADPSWVTSAVHNVDGTDVWLNTYYEAHPEHVLGTYELAHGMYNATTLNVRGDLGETPHQLSVALETITAEALERGLGYVPPSPEQLAARAEIEAAETTEDFDGTIRFGEEGFQIAYGGRLLPYPWHGQKSNAAEMRALIGMRDQARTVLEQQRATAEDTPEIIATREALHASWQEYVAEYGPINRYRLQSSGKYEPLIDEVTGEIIQDPETDKPVPDKTRPIMGRHLDSAPQAFRRDPYSALVRALENFDDESQTASPSSLLLERVVAPRTVRDHAESPSEAVSISLDRTGGIDVELVAQLRGVSIAEARDELREFTFEDPNTGDLIHAPEYLSGNVRQKLDAAEAAAAERPEFQTNVEALRAVLPAPIGIDEIEARLGAVWISPDIHRQFLVEILNDETVRVENPMPGEWEVRSKQRWTVASVSEWGTERRKAVDIAQSAMQQQQIKVEDTIDDGDKKTKKLNEQETIAAQEKAEAMQARFGEWVWEDPERARGLQDEYNRRFNSVVLRDYSSAGDYLTFPGLAETFTLRPHQRAAVARMVSEPAVGLFHQVGAGKTLEMIVGVTEQRRMGLIRKPLLVVPNHMLEQFTREWLQAYPQARLLAAGSSDIDRGRRPEFVARAASGDWDGIIMTQSSFKSIGVDPGVEAEYLQREVDALRASLEEAQGEDRMSVKRIESTVKKREEKLAKKLDLPRNTGITFEEMGVDYLVVDEAHTYKNLATNSRAAAGAIRGSDIATDLDLKLNSLRERFGDRVVTFATATPLANSITEAHVMQRYLRPDLLRDAGVEAFDAWAATFATTTTELELDTVGNFKMKERFAKFQNVPEMLRMWHVFADVKTAEDLHLPVPELRQRPDGRREPEVVTIAPSIELTDYIAHLGERAERISGRLVDPEEDNMLYVSTDGRKAALDMRMIDPSSTPVEQTKLEVVADRIFAEWEATRDNVYLDPATGEESPVRGGLQLVFSDLGVPKTGEWSAYQEIKDRLTAKGMPNDAIRFMNDAKDDRAKARLFAAARSGHVSVLIGSTQRMGVGTNVQNRVTALHHVDCPWRPADIEQRDGRAIRQYNQNPEVGIHRYVVESSFDAYMWQTVARKAAFISQVMRGRLDSRETEDVGNTTLSANEAKALASGNPLVMERATADANFQKLRKQESAHHRAQSVLASRIELGEQSVQHLRGDLEQLAAAAPRSRDISGDYFAMTIDGRRFTKRTEAAEALGKWASHHRESWQWLGPSETVTIGELGGHDVEVARDYVNERHGHRAIMLQLAGVPGSAVLLKQESFTQPGAGIITSLANRTASIPATIRKTEDQLAQLEVELHAAQEQFGQPFPKAEELAAARAELERVDAQMRAQLAPDPVGGLPEQLAPLAALARDPDTDLGEAAAQLLREQMRSGVVKPSHITLLQEAAPKIADSIAPEASDERRAQLARGIERFCRENAPHDDADFGPVGANTVAEPHASGPSL